MTLEVHSLSFSRCGRVLLDALSFEVNTASVIGIVGENGAGKSTLLHCLTGGHRCAQSVSLNGRWIEQWPLQELARQRALLPQQTHLGFPMPVHEVVAMGLTCQGRRLDRHTRARLMQRVADLADIEALLTRDHQRLSGGEQQRVQWARVLIQILSTADAGPRYLFLDEPTSALDLKHQQRLMHTLQTLKEENITSFVVIHDLNLAALHCDQLMVLKDGRLLAKGYSTNVFQPPILEQAFSVRMDVLHHRQSHKPYLINPFSGVYST